ncbi:cold-shock protein [Alicyclobacillus fodiniaquatilis]|uniref:Cold-shock protein n=1 Tax=Alicyclobacillus fodiniaquatilis TaxID=1661150 RepID=A0ABW4JQB4_9BACL
MFGKKNEEVLPDVKTDIWSCTNEDCNVWMRLGFSFDEQPKCPVCHAPMERDVKDLPEINLERK